MSYVGLIYGAFISLTIWSCTCSERHETERFNSERRLRMGLEMEEEEDAKQIVAVGAGTEEERWMGLLGVCLRVERERVTCVAIQGVLLRERKDSDLQLRLKLPYCHYRTGWRLQLREAGSGSLG